MSCDVAASVTLWLAALAHDPVAADRALLIPATSAVATSSLAREPLYARIVTEARTLKAVVQRMRRTDGSPDVAALRAPVASLAELDLKGHYDLARRGVDGDLKCILRGIAQDLPKKLDALNTASDRSGRDQALADLSYLLNDNVEVIVAPPTPPA